MLPKVPLQKDSKVTNANEAARGHCLPKSIWGKINIYLLFTVSEKHRACAVA